MKKESAIIFIIILITSFIFYVLFFNKTPTMLKAPHNQGISQAEKEKIIIDLAEDGKPILDQERKKIINNLASSSKPLSDAKKQQIIQNLKNIKN